MIKSFTQKVKTATYSVCGLVMFTLTFVMYGNEAKAQFLEDFESFSQGATSFTSNGQGFTISTSPTAFSINSIGAGTGWNGTSADAKYVDNNFAMGANPVCTLATTSSVQIKLKSFWLYADLDGTSNSLGTGGSMTVTGRLGGSTVFTASSSSGFETNLGTHSGFGLINLSTYGGSDNSNAIVDQIIISTSGNFHYFAIDAMTWQAGCSTPTITLGSNPSVCNGTTSASLTYSATSNSPNQYSIAWNAAAIIAGFTNVSLTSLPSSPITITVPSNPGAGSYTGTLTVKNSTTGCSSTGSSMGVTVNALPTITLGSNPTVTNGTTSASLTYSATSNSPNQYSIAWNAAAIIAGFTNVSLTSLPSSPVTITVPSNPGAGSYTGTLTVKNSTTGCSSTGSSMGVTVTSAAPSVTTSPATSVTSTAATLNGIVNANGSATSSLTIKYDVSSVTVSSGGGTAAIVSPSSATGTSNTSVSASVSGLIPSTTYFYRVSATNSIGTTDGTVLSFTTSAPVNTAPTFTNSSPQAFSVCQNSSSNSINSLLTVSDVDLLQTETWSVNSAPTHGILSGFNTTASSGSTSITPSGLSYTPNGNYSGNDTFTIQVSDGTATASMVVIVTVNALPVVTATADSTICNGKPKAAINFSGTGTSYTWTNNTTSIGLGASGSGNISSFTATNSGTTAVAATVIVTPVLNSCPGTADTFIITVNPTPTVSSFSTQVNCHGATALAVTPAGSAVSGTVYNWTNTNTTIGLAASGSGIIPSYTASNPGAVTTQNFGTVTVTPVANGCSGTAKTYLAIVNPIPTINAVSDQAVCNSASTTAVTFGGSFGGSASYAWTNNTTSIGLGASGTGTIAAFTANNSTSSPVAATVITTPSVTISGKTCIGIPDTFVITVNPTPSVNAVSNQAVCNTASTTAITFGGSLVSSTSYNWTNNTTSIGLAASGTGDIAPFATTNSGTSPVTATVSVTPVANTCSGAAQNFNITVNPTPALSSTVTPAPICSNTTFSYTPTSNTSGTTFAWSRALVTGISNAANTGTNNPNEALVNTTSAGVLVTYAYTLTANTCSNLQAVQVMVTPVPDVAVVSNQTLCNTASTTAINFSGSVSGTTFSWTNNNTAIGLAASGSGNIAAFTATNSTSNNISGTVTVTPSIGSCVGTPITFTITVKPTPSVNPTSDQTRCNGINTSAITLTGSSVASTSYNWINDATSIGLAASGSGNIAAFPATNATFSPIIATVIVTPVANLCSGTPDTFTITVNPTPTVNAISNQSVCNTAATNAVTFTGAVSGTTFAWTNNTTSIGLAASGSGNIASFTASNPSVTPVVATVTVTPSANSCTGTATSYDYTINPTPTVNAVSNQTRCNGVATAAITFSGPVLNTTFAWTNDNTSIGLAASGSGNIASFTATNTGTAPVTATISITPTANGCPNGIPSTFTITVNPTPTLTSTLTPTAICNASTFNYTATSAVSGTTFAWTRASVTGVTPATSSGSSAVISEALNNTTATVKTVIYAFTLTANSCSNPQNVTLQVNPNPTATINNPSVTICNNTVYNNVITSSTPGTVFAWTRSAVSGISNPAGSGTGSPNETLMNTTASPITVYYIYTLTVNGCSNPSTYATSVTINPFLLSTSQSNVTCNSLNNGSINVTASAATPPYTYSWAPSVSSSATASSLSAGTYIITVTDSVGCVRTASVTITQPAALTASSVKTNVSCNGGSNGTATATPSGGTSPYTYSWSPSGGSAALATGLVAGTYTCTITDANGCSTTTNATITQPAVLTASASATSAACATANGTITLTVSGGTTPYTYLWSNSATTQNLSSLAAGTYNVTVTDANSCTAAASATVSQQPNVVITTQPVNRTVCIGGNTTFGVVATGSSLTYQWKENGTSISNGGIYSGALTATLSLTGVTAGMNGRTYTCVVSGTCPPATSNTVTLTVPNPLLSSSLSGVVCSGTAFSYTATSATGGTTFSWTRATVAGISNSAGSGSGNINETLTNTTTAPITVTYVYTLTASGCSNVQNLVVTVNPTPLLTSGLTGTICSGNIYSYTASSATSGTTFAWTRAVVAGISNSAGSGTGNISETLVNTTSSPVVVTYVYTLIANSCTNPTTYNLVVTVNPSPSLSSTLTGAICSGNSFSYTATSATSGAVFNWTRAVVAGISNTAGSGSGASLSEVLTNTTAAAVNVSYAYTLTANGCSQVQNVVVTVNPKPTLSSSLTGAVCSSLPFNYTVGSATGGTTFGWTRAVVAGISNTSGSGSGNISETLVNTTAAPVAVTYIYTLTAGSCTNTQNVVVTVNPTPTVNAISNQTVCNNALTTLVTFTGAVTGTIFNWTNNNTGIGLVASGTNSVGIFTATNLTTAAINGTITVTPVANGCTGTSGSYTYTVNPPPNVNATGNQSICHNSLTTAVTFSGGVGGTTFSWTNNTPSIGLGASGSGNIGAFTATNAGVSPVVATITVTPSAGGCTGTAASYTYTVNPTPTVAGVTSQAMCNGVATTAVVFSGAVSGTVFSWTGTTAVIGIGASGSGNIGSFIAGNAGVAPVIDTITVTPSANGCTGTATKYTYTVNPTPTVNAITNQTVCHNTSTAAVTFSGAVAGTTFSWTNNTTSIGLGATGTGNIGVFTAANITTTPVVATVTVVPTANLCTGTAKAYTYTVNPLPALSSAGTATACSGSLFSYTATSATGGATYGWTRAVVAGISNGAGSGTGNISETLTNTTTSAINVTYVYTLTANSCTNPVTYNVVTTVNATPSVTSQPVSSVIWSGGNASFSAAGAGTGVSYQWQENGTNIVNGGVYGGATTTTLTLTGATAALNGKVYQCVVSGTCTPAAVSNTATLTVYTSPVIGGSTSCPGALLTLTTTAPATQIVWNLNGIPVSTVSGTPPIANTYTGSSAGNYTAIVSSPAGVIQSNTYTINSVPVIVAQPVNTAIWEGGNASFAVTATGSSISYQWQLSTNGGGIYSPVSNGGVYSGATANTLAITGATAAMSGYLYRCVVSGACPGQTTDAGVLRVYATPVISGTTCPGGILSLSSTNVNQISWSLNGTLIGLSLNSWAATATTVGGGNGSGNGANQLSGAGGIYVDGLGTLYVADVVNHRVQKWAAPYTTGVTVAGGNGSGSAANQLSSPAGVYVDGSGNVYVADNGNSRVQKWASPYTSGVTVAGGNGAGSASNQMDGPVRVYVDNTGNVYVTDKNNHRVQKWGSGSASGITVAGGNGQGSGSSQLSNPVGIYVDGSGNVYVADQGNHRVQRWASGALSGVTVAGGLGAGSSVNQLNNPSGVSIDGNGNLYISDQSNNRIQQWSNGALSGSMVAGTGAAGAGATQLNVPVDLSIDMQGYIYVSDQGNNRVQRFNPTITGTITAPFAGTYTATVTSFAGNTGSSANYTVNAQPAVTSNPSNSTVCAGGNTTFTVAATGAGISYQWQLSTDGGSTFNDIVIGAPYSNTTTATLTITGATNGMNTYQYRCRVPGSCTPQAVSTAGILTVNPIPALSSLGTASVCNNSLFSYTATGTVSGTVFSWTRAVVAGISNSAGSGSVAGISETLVNTTTAPVAVTYVYAMTANGCSGTQNVVLTVNPTPALSSSLSGVVCSGVAYNYTATSATGGSSFSWTRAVVGGISNGAGSGSGNISETLTNTTSNPVTVTYVYTITANGCNNTQNLVVTVNPTPLLSSVLTGVVCSGTGYSYTPASATSGSSFGWTRAVVAGISNTAGSGAGAINETLTNTTANPVAVTYIYTVTANGCGNTQNLVVTVNPKPVLSSALTGTTCNNTLYSYTATSATVGTAFGWTRAVVAGISNSAGSGSGNIGETLVNTTAAPVNVTYIYTLSANGCVNTQNLVLTVYPTPVLSSTQSPAAICNNSTFNYTVTSATTGTVFGWTRAVVSGISNIAGSGSGNISEILTNTTAAAVSVTYVYTLTANGCVNTQNVVVSVKPTPALSSSLTGVVCSNTPFSYTATSATTGTVFTWTRGIAAGISNGSSSGTGNISETLINTTTAPATVTYVYTLASNGCNNIQNVVVTVNPTPTLSSTLTPGGICSGSSFAYTPGSGTAGATFGWTRAVVAGISNGAGSGTGSILETLTNTLPNAVNVSYIYTVSANGCTNPATYNVVVAVNTAPALVTQPASQTVCAGAAMSFGLTATGTGLTYLWYVNTGGGFTPLSNGGVYGGVLTATLNISPVGVGLNGNIYHCTVSGTCPSSVTTLDDTLTVNTLPAVISSPGAQVLCAGGNALFTASGSGTGLGYQWQLSTNGGSTYGNISNGGVYSGAGTSALSVTGVTAGMNNYLYRCVLSGACNPAVNTTAALLTVNTLPAITVQLTDTTSCVGSSTSFRVTATGSGLTYRWQSDTGSGFGDVSNGGVYSGATTLRLQITGLTAGMNNWQYRCIVSGTCVPSVTSNVGTLTVNTLIAITTQAHDTAVCSGNTGTMSVTAIGSGLSYQWQGDTGTGYYNLSNTLVYSGTTTAVLQVSGATLGMNGYKYRCVVSGSCQPTVTGNQVVLTVNPLPSATITAGGPTSFCPGSNVVLQANTGVGLSYQWKLNGVSVTGLNASIYTVTVAGVYTVLVTDNNGCMRESAPDTTRYIAVPPAAVTSSGSLILCQGQSVTLNANTGTGISYHWKLNGVFISSATASVYVAGSSGIYTVEESYGNGCYSNSGAVVVTVNALPVASVSYSGTGFFCTGDSLQLLAGSGAGYTYQWKLNGLNIVGATGISYWAKVSGSYSVEVTGAGGCKATSASVPLTANTAPVASISPSGQATICAGGSLALTAPTGPGYGYQWKLNGGNIPGATSSGYTATIGGSYTVSVTNSGGSGCMVTSAATVVVVSAGPSAGVTLGGPTTFCNGDSVILSATGGVGYNYQWQFNGSNIAGANGLSYTVLSAGNYRVVVSDSSCTNTSSSTLVVVNPAPAATVSMFGHSVICAGGSLVLQAGTGAGYSYQWMLNGGAIPGAVNAFYSATDSGVYTVQVTSSNGCFAISVPVSIVKDTALNPVITNNAGLLCVDTSYATVQWFFNNQPIAGATGPCYQATQNGAYTAAVSNDSGCYATAAPVIITNVGVKNVKGAVVKVYPNPATTTLYIEASVKVRARLMGMRGEEVLSREDAKQIDISLLANGVYMLYIYDTDGNILKTERIVKNAE